MIDELPQGHRQCQLRAGGNQQREKCADHHGPIGAQKRPQGQQGIQRLGRGTLHGGAHGDMIPQLVLAWRTPQGIPDASLSTGRPICCNVLAMIARISAPNKLGMHMLELRVPRRSHGSQARPRRIGAIFGALTALCVAAVHAADTTTREETSGPLQEITVTATRREESLSKVPISVTALTQDAMDLRGIKDFQDIVRFTPGVNVDNSGTNNIAIRGIASTGGAGTTGIYIDDTPIPIR